MRISIIAALGKSLSIGVMLFLTAPPLLSAPSDALTRLLVEKRPSGSSDDSQPPYLPVEPDLISASGFVLIADYTSFTLFEGPSAGVDSLISAVSAAGYVARVITDIDDIQLLRHTIDADSGLATPPYDGGSPAPTGLRGLYLIALRGYPTQDWLDDLGRQGVNIIEPLPPAAYLADGPRSVIEILAASTSYVRGAFRMTPPMKTEPMKNFPADSDSPFRPVVIDAYEFSRADSVEPFLRSVAEDDTIATISRAGGRVQYAASLAEIDIATLSQFEAVYSVTPVSAGQPSSERQGMLVALPTLTGGITLPTNVAQGGYTNYIKVVKGISDFGNTKVAVLDSGFDDLGLGLHPDFTCTAGIPNCPSGTSSVITSFGATPFNQTSEPNVDNTTHGTITASVITGWPTAGVRQDPGSYRYGLGLAPTVLTAMDKFFSASTQYPGANGNILTRLTNALTALAPWGPNIVNHSWNGGGTPINYCGYENTSQYLDKHTRTANVLHVVAAGNTNEATCPYVRSPATSKNAIAVGATENFTLGPSGGWTNNSGAVDDNDPRNDYAGTCTSNYFPAAQDARNVSTISAKRYPSSLSKPDVVAPGFRVTGPVSRNTSWEICPAPPPPTQDDTCNGIFCNKSIATYTFRYGFSAGTSFAAPVVTGTATVLRKWYRNQNGVDPSPAMTKAMVIGGAIDIAGGRVRSVTSDNYNNPADPTLGYVQDPYQGFGFTSMVRLLDSSANHLYKDQTTVLTPASSTWTSNPVIVNSATKTRLTLVWTDRHGTTLGGPNGQTYTTVNDLTLKVCKLGFSTCWYGNVWAGNGNSQGIPNGGSVIPDTINNVEYVIVPAGTFLSGEQIILRVQVYVLSGDGIDPNGSTLRQDFAVFGTNVH